MDGQTDKVETYMPPAHWPETAAYLFWTRGFEAVGVNDICKEAGINKGTLYHFYKNKQELVECLKLAMLDGIC